MNERIIPSGQCRNCAWYRQALLQQDGSVTRAVTWSGPAGEKSPGQCEDCRRWSEHRS